MPVSTDYIKDLKRDLPSVERKRRHLEALLKMQLEGDEEEAIRLIGNWFTDKERNLLRFTLRRCDLLEGFLSELLEAGVEAEFVERVRGLVEEFGILEDAFDMVNEKSVGIENKLTEIRSSPRIMFMGPEGGFLMLKVTLFSHNREVYSYQDDSDSVLGDARLLLWAVANAHEKAQSAKVRLNPAVERLTKRELERIAEEVRSLCRCLNMDVEALWRGSPPPSSGSTETPEGAHTPSPSE